VKLFKKIIGFELVAGVLVILLIGWQDCFTAITKIFADAPPTVPYNITQVLGQPDVKNTMVNEITATTGFHLGGVHVDSSGRIYAFDSGNNRILGFNSYSTDRPADIVIGQTSVTNQGTSNGDNTLYNNPTASTLSLMPYPDVPSTLEALREGQMATDGSNNLYVMDLNNNRVLKYNDPFATDQIADDVWGQPDFTTRTAHCGLNSNTPTASTFCTEWPSSFNGLSTHIFMAGVEIDPSGNLWVADAGNNRVLRFPNVSGTISKTADIVLGQTDFTSNSARAGADTTLTKMLKPISLKFDPSTGDLYVLDGELPGEARMMHFTYPFSTGMAATSEFGRGNLNWPRGFILDPTIGGFWINDGQNVRIAHFTSDGVLDQVIGQPNLSTTACSSDPTYGYWDLNTQKQNICNPQGEIGLSPDHSMYIAIDANSDQKSIVKFSLPITRGTNGLAVANGRLLYSGWNTFSGKTFDDNYGMAVTKDTDGAITQLFVSDQQRVLVWNNPTTKGTFAQADYVVGQDAFNTNLNNNGGDFSSITLGSIVTGGGYLWIAADHRIFVIATPITGSGKNYPIAKTITSNTYGGGNVVWSDDLSKVSFNPVGLAYDTATNSLWVSDSDNHRVFRITTPMATATVDLVLGQPNKGTTTQNGGLGSVNAKGFANPWALQFDKLGNLYVVDDSYEGGANNRVLRFDATQTVPTGGVIFPFPDSSGVYAKQNFTTTSNWGAHTPQTPTYVTFDSQNRMIMLVDSYGNTQYERAYIYTPNHAAQAEPQPAFTLPIAFGQGAHAIFYQDDNHLVIQDHTWDRVLFVDLSQTSTTPTLAPIAPPSSSNNSGNNSSGSSNTPQSCTDISPQTAPHLFEIDSTDTTATLYFTPINTTDPYYNITYGYTQDDERFGDHFKGYYSTGTVKHTISNLQPAMTYYFRIYAGNGCSIGPASNTMSMYTKSSGTPSEIDVPSYPVSDVEKTPSTSTLTYGPIEELTQNLQTVNTPIPTPRQEVKKTTTPSSYLSKLWNSIIQYVNHAFSSKHSK